MQGKVRRRLTPELAVATLALAVALGGTGYAAAKINGKNLVNRSVAGSKLKGNTLTGTQVNESKLKQVPAALRATTAINADRAKAADTATSATTAGSATSAATAANSGALGGEPPSSYVTYGGPIPSGKTVTGVWGCEEIDTNTDQGNAANPAAEECNDAVSLPAPASAALTDSAVNAAGNADLSISAGDANGSGCTGDAQAPTAPAGRVCIYPSYTTVEHVQTVNGAGIGTAGSRYGFRIRVTGPNNSTDMGIGGVWAYTAP